MVAVIGQSNAAARVDEAGTGCEERVRASRAADSCRAGPVSMQSDQIVGRRFIVPAGNALDGDGCQRLGIARINGRQRM